MSADANTFLIVAPLLIAAIAIFALSVHVRGKLLFRMLQEQLDPELWRSLGAPESIIDAFRDAEHRWQEFVRSGEYRRRLDQSLVDRIDENRRRTRRMLVIFAIAIALLAYRFWPLLTGT
jgi:hypothetical protein